MTSYWLSDICSLTNSANINPFASGDKNFKFNSLTRLIILITLCSYVFLPHDRNQILLAGGISLSLSIIIYMLTHSGGGSDSSKERSDEDKKPNPKPKETPKETPKEKKSDHDINVANHVTLDYVPPDTELKKGVYFFDKDKTPQNVVKTDVDPKKLLSTGKQVQSGSVKQHHGLLGKNVYHFHKE